MNTEWKCVIPDGESGNVRLESFEISEMAAAIGRIRGEMLKPGNYKRLYVNGVLMMSDTPKERHDHFEFIRNAKGHVLINGLGMGCCLASVIDKVDSATVIEKSQDVINLIGKHFPKAEIICADAFEWKPKKRYNAVWHDIWSDICADNLPEMHRLHRKYGRFADWQGSWSRDELEYRNRRYG